MSNSSECISSTSYQFGHNSVASVGSLFLQRAHSASSYTPPVTNSSNGNHFNSNSFVSSLPYNVPSVLPMLHQSSQGPTDFNQISSVHNKPATLENFAKLQQPVANNRTNPNSVYWSTQSQFSPFGVLPHEINADQVQQTKITCPTQLYYTGRQINAINGETINLAKSKDGNLRTAPCISKSVTTIYQQENNGYRNGIIPHASKINQNSNEIDSSNVAHDYRTFRSINTFHNTEISVAEKCSLLPPGHRVDGISLPQPEINQPRVPEKLNDYLSYVVPSKAMKSNSFHAINPQGSYREIQSTNCHPTNDRVSSHNNPVKFPYPVVTTTTNLFGKEPCHCKTAVGSNYMIFNIAGSLNKREKLSNEMAESQLRHTTLLPNPNIIPKSIDTSVIVRSDQDYLQKSHHVWPQGSQPAKVETLSYRNKYLNLSDSQVLPHKHAETHQVTNPELVEFQYLALRNNEVSTPQPLITAQEVTNNLYASKRISKINAPQGNNYPVRELNGPFFEQKQIIAGCPVQQLDQLYSNYSTNSNNQTLISNNGSTPQIVANSLQQQKGSSDRYCQTFQTSTYSLRQEFATTKNNVVESVPKKSVVEDCSKVRVPNIEQEFQFLFDPQLPHYNEIISNEGKENYKLSGTTFYRKNIDFLTSYIKFLENNCKSVDKLADIFVPSAKNWSRNKSYQPMITNKEQTQNTFRLPTKEVAKPVIKEPTYDFENDPRYYPLPKSSDKRKLDSSSEDERVQQMKISSKRTETKVDRRRLGGKEIKDSGQVKTKLDIKAKKNLLTIKKKLENLKKVKSKDQEHQSTFTDQQSHQKVKTMRNKKLSQNKTEQSPRIVFCRKVKKNKIKYVSESDSELDIDSDADPSWQPNKNIKDVSLRRSNSGRSIRLRINNCVRTENNKSDIELRVPSTIKEKGNSPKSQKKVPTSDQSMKSKNNLFYIQKNQSKGKRTILRKVGDKILQKYEQLNGDGKFSVSKKFVKLNEISWNRCKEVDVNVVERNKTRFVLKLRKKNISTALKIRENFFKESLCYEPQFSVYVQTLVSQALNSSFMEEIVKEKDVYFLDNMKVIDDVTATYLSDLTSITKWSSSSIVLIMKTWPCVSIKKHHQPALVVCKCFGCGVNDVNQIAKFYGQPYKRESLKKCQSNSNISKTVNVCSSCGKKIQLFNKIWHQKYHVFVECDKYVKKKKNKEENKSTTDILNELLADVTWLSKLFYDIRNTWLQIWILVQTSKKL